MKTKILIFALLGIILNACKEDSPEDKASRMGLECINGWVFHKHTEYPMFGIWRTTLTPLNVECPSGKVEVQW